VRDALAGRAYDLILVEDIFLLPFAFSLGGGAKIFFDAREYYPRQHEDQFLGRVFGSPPRDLICRRYLARCHQVFTVSPGLAEGYLRTYGVPAQVIRSTPALVHLEVKPTDSYRIRMVHHGVANRNRKLELMIELVGYLDTRYSLDFYLTGNQDYIEALKRRASGSSRVRFNPPVGLEDLIPTLAGYDLGLFFFEPTTFNLKHCLPNKLFEFVQARLAVVIGPVPDMADVVSAYGCGVVAKSFDARELADALNALDPRTLNGFKENSACAAKELNWELEGAKLSAAIEGVLGGLED
jgi:glycosyltransferase involved in cell wall biosynthesis